MILIQGEEDDISTFHVIDYLLLNKSHYIKVNREDDISNVQLKFSNGIVEFAFSHKDVKIHSESITAHWYRRGELKISRKQFNEPVGAVDNKTINRYLLEENFSTTDLINRLLDCCEISIGSIYAGNTTKLQQIHEAQKCGLEIPETLITSTKADLVEFMAKTGRVATKGINRTFSESGADNRRYYMYTSIVDEANVRTIPDTFSPTLFQAYVPKKYEVRTFFIKDRYYSMAIFSQSSEKTTSDFRNYDFQKPNRTIPYRLPVFVQSKLIAVMKNLSLDTGSIDMIVTPDNRYVFLEVNPDGQFGMVSYPCNYFIERDIAKTLSNDKAGN